ncbi:hypothetical protein H17ap60334_10150 [Thermosipho africanus H17ap60334]|uniref:hypothetical protein n=1 Tax=Thermosipho TaxID=2420 RepID=UPI00028E8875|nr:MULTISPECIES: hypothetical protein [Thermosipho]EKF48643.1 hypothetical protein H17ap60334_10150 [Thermosipho africanus H17ap60334]MBZ4649429.1 hypothetical protein [Thermosipho sp. (in: thermotogales)]RDI92583.1 hypothetical protein Ob7_00800 [Thermosipho africanus Ob7]
MRILLSNSFLVEEFEPDIWVTNDFENLQIPYTLFYNGQAVFIYDHFKFVDTILNNSEKIIDFGFFKAGILVGSSISVAENYLKDVELFIAFDKTNYTSKFLLRKAQTIVASDISGKTILSLFIYKDKTNYIKTLPNIGIVDDSMSHVLWEKEFKESKRVEI